MKKLMFFVFILLLIMSCTLLKPRSRASVVETLSGKILNDTTAVFSGTVESFGESVLCYFQYDVWSLYDGSKRTAYKNLKNMDSVVAICETVFGLNPSSNYKFCIVSEFCGGASRGETLSFVTNAILASGTTLPATSINAASAILNATVDGENSDVVCYFEWGLTKDYGNTVFADSFRSYGYDRDIVYLLEGLDPKTEYNYRLVVKNSRGTFFGNNESFKTSVELEWLDTYYTSGECLDLWTDGNYAYIADGEKGLSMMDISDKRNIINLSTLGTPGFAYDIELSGGYAIMTVLPEYLIIIDVSNPYSLLSFSSVEGLSQPRCLKVSGDYAFVCDQNGISVVNISDKHSPFVEAAVTDCGNPLELFLYNDYLYVVSDKLYIINISDPKNPYKVSSFYMDCFMTSVAVSGNYAYITDGNDNDTGNSRIISVDIGNILFPKYEGEREIYGSASNIQVSGTTAYVASTEDEITVFDISNPSQMEIIQYTPSYKNSKKLFVKDQFIFVAGGEYGFSIYREAQ